MCLLSINGSRADDRIFPGRDFYLRHETTIFTLSERGIDFLVGVNCLWYDSGATSANAFYGVVDGFTT